MSIDACRKALSSKRTREIELLTTLFEIFEKLPFEAKISVLQCWKSKKKMHFSSNYKFALRCLLHENVNTSSNFQFFLYSSSCLNHGQSYIYIRQCYVHIRRPPILKKISLLSSDTTLTYVFRQLEPRSIFQLLTKLIVYEAQVVEPLSASNAIKPTNYVWILIRCCKLLMHHRLDFNHFHWLLSDYYLIIFRVIFAVQSQ